MRWATALNKPRPLPSPTISKITPKLMYIDSKLYLSCVIVQISSTCTFSIVLSDWRIDAYVLCTFHVGKTTVSEQHLYSLNKQHTC